MMVQEKSNTKFARAMSKAPKISGQANLHQYGMQLIFGEATYARETSLKSYKGTKREKCFVRGLETCCPGTAASGENTWTGYSRPH